MSTRKRYRRIRFSRRSRFRNTVSRWRARNPSLIPEQRDPGSKFVDGYLWWTNCDGSLKYSTTAAFGNQEHMNLVLPGFFNRSRIGNSIRCLRLYCRVRISPQTGGILNAENVLVRFWIIRSRTPVVPPGVNVPGFILGSYMAGGYAFDGSVVDGIYSCGTFANYQDNFRILYDKTLIFPILNATGTQPLQQFYADMQNQFFSFNIPLDFITTFSNVPDVNGLYPIQTNALVACALAEDYDHALGNQSNYNCECSFRLYFEDCGIDESNETLT